MPLFYKGNVEVLASSDTMSQMDDTTQGLADTAKPHLEHRDEFIEALAQLTVSERAKQALAQTHFVALMGVAGSGRNTIINELVASGKYAFVVSDTTRQPKFRNGHLEQNGVEYFFRDEVEMLDDIKNGEFIEAELIHNQQVSGVSIRALEAAAADGKIPITDLEYKGINVIADSVPNASIIALLPPNYDVWLKRINAREVMEHEEFQNRLRTAERVLESILLHTNFKIIVNDTVDGAVSDVRNIIEQGQYNEKIYADGRRVAEDLLKSVQQALTA